MLIMIIYKATNILNNLSYIGLTTRTLSERKHEHLRHIDNENTYFHKALKKYGADNFHWEIIDNSANSREELAELEKHYIKELNTLAPNGYNITSGGENPTFNDRRDYNYGNNPAARKVINLTTLEIFDTVKRASETYSVSSNSIRKAILKGSPCQNCFWDYYDETKKYLKPQIKNNKTSRKQVKNKKTNKIYLSISAAAENNGIARKTIRDICNGLRKGEWEYYYPDQDKGRY